jgi:predicted GNAT family acetyltransferase
MSTVIRHEADHHRYVLVVDDREAGLADYRTIGETIVFTHTEVDPSRRKHGLGSNLVKGALDDVRINSKRKVVPQCPFVADWIDVHPEYHELVERG